MRLLALCLARQEVSRELEVRGHVEAAPGLPGLRLGLVIVTRVHLGARPQGAVWKIESYCD